MSKKKETIGEKIRRLRLAKKLRQVDLAKAIGVSEYTVMRWEGEDDHPNEANAHALGRYFRVPWAEFHSERAAPSPVGRRIGRLEKRMTAVEGQSALLQEQLTALVEAQRRAGDPRVRLSEPGNRS